MPKRKTKKATLEERFLLAWEEHGYPNSDITREHKFHPKRRWKFDFAFPTFKVAVEIEGLGAGGMGRHQRVGGLVKDAEKYNMAAEMGWTVLRCPSPFFTQKTEFGESVLEQFIEQVCRVVCSNGN